MEGGLVAVEAGGFGGGVEEGEVGGLGVVEGLDGFEGFEVGFEFGDVGVDELEEGFLGFLAGGELGAEGGEVFGGFDGVLRSSSASLGSKTLSGWEARARQAISRRSASSMWAQRGRPRSWGSSARWLRRQ